MESRKYHIEKNTIQETMVIPLWSRKFATEIYGDGMMKMRIVKIAHWCLSSKKESIKILKLILNF